MRIDREAQLSIEQIALALSPFTAGLRVCSSELAKIQEYIEILTYWNQSVSLTAVSDKTEIVARHFGESIFAAAAVPILSGRLADVGSGAGFPGLPLKIVSEGLGVVLLEPNLKKSAFLNEVATKLELNDVEVSRSRYEEYRPGGAPFDFICSRALGGYRQLLRWAKGMLAPDGARCALAWGAGFHPSRRDSRMVLGSADPDSRVTEARDTGGAAASAMTGLFHVKHSR